MLNCSLPHHFVKIIVTGTPGTGSLETPGSTTSQAAENSAAASPLSHPESSQGTNTGSADAAAIVEQPAVWSKRKHTSDVWDDFEKELKKGKWRAVCNWCHRDFA